MTSRGFARGRSAALGFIALGTLVGAGAAPALSAENNWAGLYAGLHAGGAWGSVSVLDNEADGVPPGPFPYSAAGGFGGGTAGFNLQAGGIVTGIEGDIGYMDLQGAGIIASSNPIYHQDATLGGGLYGDVTGRLGFSFNQTLVYGKGGFAFYSGQAMQATTKPVYAPTGTGTFTGWTVAAGIEHSITPSMSFKIEYQHFDFGPQAGYQTNVGDLDSDIGYKFYNWTDLMADSVKVGVNWHLN